MKHSIQRLFGLSLLAPLALGAASMAQQQAPKKPTTKAQPVDGKAFYLTQVKPILAANCLACHSGEKPAEDLNLTSREGILKGGASGPAVIPGKPADSLLLKAINHLGPKMPASGKLPQREIDILTKWVGMGLPWGESGKKEPVMHAGPPPVNEKNKKFWSFQPVSRPTAPPVKASAWVKNPIDAFVLAKLEKSGLKPNPPASRTALLRRAYYDLIGLPPTPSEVRAFLSDKTPNAYEKVVDNLLNSPQYGEKWGRHWLDLVRYAETNSYERDGNKPNAWRYRDYVIRAFNTDMPYNRFVSEQIAGDEMDERTSERLIATGYYRMGIWDDEPSDPKQALYDDMDDLVSTTSQVFLGLTVNCARCHDHKLDPIPQSDYYRLLSFFNGVKRFGDRSYESIERNSLRPIAPESEVRKQQAEVAAHNAKRKANQDAIVSLEAKVRNDLIPVEKEEFRDDQARPGILKKRVGTLLTAEEFKAYTDLRAERNRLNRFQPSSLDMALCVTEVGAKPRDTFVLGRGNPTAEGQKVEPGFLQVLSPPEPVVNPTRHGDTSGRRTALAAWLTSKQNPLPARVMVNRIWQGHFGRGIVRTTSNFGFQGTRPTHKELLDWLAAEFMNPTLGSDKLEWGMKRMHRLIMTSNTYRMSSQENKTAIATDPENDLLWRYDMRRLLAEETRDSILAANGSLNLKMGGPSIFTTMPEAVLAGQSRPGEGWGKSSEIEQRRRSVYIFVKRSLAVPIIASFDGPETDFSCPVRFATTQPTQAIGMLNSDFVNEQGRVFARYAKQSVPTGLVDQVNFVLWRVMQREPSQKEIRRGVELVQRLQEKHKKTPDEALAYFCVVALNLNEFMYLD